MQVFSPITRRPNTFLNPIRSVLIQRAFAGTATTTSRPQQFRRPSFAKTNPTSITRPLFATTAVKSSDRRLISTSLPNYAGIHPSPLNSLPNMAPGIDELVKLTSDLQLDNIRDKFPTCYPETNPIDVYRAHLTNVLEKITGVDTKIIYNAIQWTQGLDKGDLIVAAPALRVKGKKPDELVKEWEAKVSLRALLLGRSRNAKVTPDSSQRMTPSLRSQW